MYRIKLPHFEGALDLLLFFIKRDELDIYDIPISKITKDFMDYLRLMEKLDLEVAGDFILMAATLMQIKVRMLLPREVDEKGEEIDPRADLVKALIEYKQYKEMSEELSIFESDQRKQTFRGNYNFDERESPEELNTLLKNITLYDLIKAFKRAIEQRPKEATHQIRRLNVSIDEQINYILGKVENGKEMSFIPLIGGMKEKIRIIVTFIAMLELVKMGKIGLKESPDFNDFIVYGIENGQDIQLDN
ncbi:MAG: segregation/condensation protein A [Melioribacteraceae bacterium]|nr:segregation/condensation protein A [Melioribacteraceae bacterium]MCF8352927.1 segregation/condensation protein A [Melioribacteraceae bacterium]MCF8395268.1 segregation/condensation protein A [Melioribacteraceae bacterium]MCF8417444.1 segregation/condensation protein A [Melioribacteraceae bacterium]